jgi:hypothetical protein
LSTIFFGFIAVSGVSQRWDSKPLQKKLFTKEIVSKGFYKIFVPKSKTDFLSLFFGGVSR